MDRIDFNELMKLYDNSPSFVLYRGDLLDVKVDKDLCEIAASHKDLNPIDVVLESLVNVLTEQLSIGRTQTRDVVYMDKAIRGEAIDRITRMAKENPAFLENIHKKWLEELHSFLAGLGTVGAQMVTEAAYQVSLRFRISGSSSLRAIGSLVHGSSR